MSIFDYIAALSSVPTANGMGLPMLITDVPGVGKTTAIAAIMAQYGPVYVYDPGQHGASDIGRVPVVSEDRSRIVHPPPSWAQPFFDAPGTIILDDYRTFDPEQRTGLLGLTGSRRLGGRKLHPGVRVICLGNAVSDGPSSAALDCANATRLIHLAWDVSPSYTRMAIRASIRGEVYVPPVSGPVGNWEECRDRASDEIDSFLAAKPEMMIGTSKEDCASARPRTWTMAGQGLAACRQYGLDPRMVLSGCVGDDVALAFLTWLSERLLSPAEYLAGAPLPTRPDQVLSVCNSVTAWVSLEEHIVPIFALALRMVDVAPDIAAVMGRAGKDLALKLSAAGQTSAIEQLKGPVVQELLDKLKGLGRKTAAT